MVKARKFIYAKHFSGLPKETDLELVDEEIPLLKNGEFLSEAIFLSVDPFMRAYVLQLPLGSTMPGAQVAKVIESKNPKHPTGQYILGNFGWRTHTVSDDKAELWVIPDPGKLPISLSLGVLGVPGTAAYFGFLEICQPKYGETVVVIGAAGAVGSIVGQIAKIKGCTVVGIAGKDEKGKWLVDELNFDHFINYNDPDFEKKLEEVTPKGIDCFFDSVGGEANATIISKMNPFGRVSLCGAVSVFNRLDNIPKAAPFLHFMIRKQLKMEGFVVTRWDNRKQEATRQCKEWILEGKLKYRETVTEGFENMSQAFINVMKGDNVGKAIVKV